MRERGSSVNAADGRSGMRLGLVEDDAGSDGGETAGRGWLISGGALSELGVVESHK